MKFDNTTVRRQDRLFSEADALDLLKNGEYGYLSLAVDNTPYGLPISFGFDNENSVYFHCALEGRKLRFIEENGIASFCVVGKTNVLSDKFSTEYQSIILSGKLKIVTNEPEKRKGLELLIDKYSPKDKVAGMKYLNNSVTNTGVLRLDIETISGKQRKM